IAGPDRALWFCESGTSKIGRLDADCRALDEFALPESDAAPIGITPGGDGAMWFCAKRANKIGRITLRGEITLYPLPNPNAGPDGTLLGPDGNVWFSESAAGRIGRITPRGDSANLRTASHSAVVRSQSPLAMEHCGLAKPPPIISAASRLTGS